MTTLEQTGRTDEARDSLRRSGAVSSCNDLLEVRLSDQTSLFKDGRLLVWFSCGAASAVALKLVAHLNPMAIYCDTSANEHPDNVRFRADVERWTGIAVTVIKSTRFSTVEEVADEKQYMAGPKGAPCTVEMKKVPRFNFQRADDTHIFGFSLDEKNRLKKFEADNHDMNLAWPLVQAEMTKADCLEMIVAAGIALPVLYTLGFANNNCLGCFKATSAKYWNRTRRHFPAVFKLRCEQSRRLGVRLVRYKGVRIFLDELPEDATDNINEDLSCGPQCADARTSNAAGEPRGNVTPANLTFKASQKRPAELARPACYAAGDYVLASKYHDGDPQDHWCIGFYKEPYLHCGYDQRHIIVDGNGQPFRANGFRRVKKISKERGAWMLQNARIIETSGMSVWHFARCSMKPHNDQAQRPLADSGAGRKET